MKQWFKSNHMIREEEEVSHVSQVSHLWKKLSKILMGLIITVC